MRTIALEVIIATVFGMTDPARAQRLRAATLALLREGDSRRFLVQTMIASSRGGWDRPFPRMRAAIAAVDAVVLDELAARRAAATGAQRRPRDAMRTARRSRPAAVRRRALRRHAHPAARRPRHHRVHPELGARTDQPPPGRARRLQPAALDGDDDYLDAVVKETMRLRPVFPLTGRLAAEDFELPGLTIPAGTMVVPFITLVNRRPDLYDEPLAFRPERFLTRKPRHLLLDPVRRRRRRCIGAAFALTEARTVLRTILRTPPRTLPPARGTHRASHRHHRPRPRRTHHPPTPHRCHHHRHHATPREHAQVI